MARAHAILTQRGMSNVLILPLANSASVMTPMVFCASLLPCENAMKAADTGCRMRNQRLTGAGGHLRTSQKRPVMSSQAKTKPSAGLSGVLWGGVFDKIILPMIGSPALAI